MKKIVTFLIAILVSFCMINVNAAEGDVFWKIDNNILYLRSSKQSGYDSLYSCAIDSEGDDFTCWEKHRDNIVKIIIEEPINPHIKYFYKMSKLKTIENLNYLDLSEQDDVSGMFEGCSSLEKLDYNLNLDSATNTSYMFKDCTSLKELPEGFNAPKSKNLTFMFQNCTSLKKIPDSFKINVGYNPLMQEELPELSGIFSNMTSLEYIPQAIFDIIKQENVYRIKGGYDQFERKCFSIFFQSSCILCGQTTNYIKKTFQPTIEITANKAVAKLPIEDKENYNSFYFWYYNGDQKDLIEQIIDDNFITNYQVSSNGRVQKKNVSETIDLDVYFGKEFNLPEDAKGKEIKLVYTNIFLRGDKCFKEENPCMTKSYSSNNKATQMPCMIDEYKISKTNNDITSDGLVCSPGGVRLYANALYSVSSTHLAKIILIDEKNNKLSGAEFELSKDNTTLKNWVSTKEAIEFNLLPGKYSIKQTKSIKGYEKTKSVEFEVDASGKILSKNLDRKDNRLIVIYNNSIINPKTSNEQFILPIFLLLMIGISMLYISNRKTELSN